MPRGAVWLVLAACGVLGSEACAQQAKPYVVEGPGRESCADYVAAPAEGETRRLTAAWLTGYLTAHNRAMSDVFDLTPWQSPALLLGLLEQYCYAHPDDIVERGAQELVGYLRPSALEEEAELVSIRNGQSVVLVYRPVLSRIRAALDAAGFTPGAGVTGLTTALESYQTSENLERTGLPDQRTLARLLE